MLTIASVYIALRDGARTGYRKALLSLDLAPVPLPSVDVLTAQMKAITDGDALAHALLDLYKVNSAVAKDVCRNVSKLAPAAPAPAAPVTTAAPAPVASGSIVYVDASASDATVAALTSQGFAVVRTAPAPVTAPAPAKSKSKA